nr:MAG TPA: hypothetical protein [Caudoviricetes sp.]
MLEFRYICNHRIMERESASRVIRLLRYMTDAEYK